MKRTLIGILAIIGFSLSSAGDGLTRDEFVREASEAGLAQLQLSQLAIRKSDSRDVLALSQRLVVAHNRTDDYLSRIAKGKGLAVSQRVNAPRSEAMARLGTLSGADFDTAFAAQIAAEQQGLLDLLSQAAQLQDPELAAFAAWALPRIQEHKQMADLVAEAHGSAEPVSPASGQLLTAR